LSSQYSRASPQLPRARRVDPHQMRDFRGGVWRHDGGCGNVDYRLADRQRFVEGPMRRGAIPGCRSRVSQDGERERHVDIVVVFRRESAENAAQFGRGFA